MIRLVGISGSLRHASFNTALLNNAAQILPDRVSLEVRTLHGIPLYDGDEEAAHGIPGVFKNAIDWASRPPGDISRVFKGRPFAIMGASPGGFGTILAQNHWLPVLRTLGVQLWTGGSLMVSRAGKTFDADGAISDPEMREHIRIYLAEFLDHLTKGAS